MCYFHSDTADKQLSSRLTTKVLLAAYLPAVSAAVAALRSVPKNAGIANTPLAHGKQLLMKLCRWQAMLQ